MPQLNVSRSKGSEFPNVYKPSSVFLRTGNSVTYDQIVFRSFTVTLIQPDLLLRVNRATFPSLGDENHLRLLIPPCTRVHTPLCIRAHTYI